MKLKTLSFKENLYFSKEKNVWELEELQLGDKILLVGKNASGKTRIINIINNLAKIIRGEFTYNKIKDNEWFAEFILEKDKIFKYNLHIKDGKIDKEELYINKEPLLIRSKNKARIKIVGGNEVDINPPVDKLTIQVRRDEKEYPFLEELINWAEGTHGLDFGNTSAKTIILPQNNRLDSLNIVPSIVNELNPKSIKEVVKDFNKLGYDLESMYSEFLPGIPREFKFLFVKEKGLEHPISQEYLSDGMYRALALIIYVQYMVQNNISEELFLVDNLSEGLDYDRSSKLLKLLFDKVDKYKFNFIFTSNDYFLINSVEVKYWNIIYRVGSITKSYNYKKNKEEFDKFYSSGLSNLDLFTSNFINK